MGKRRTALFLCILMLAALPLTAGAQGILRGYDKAQGYVYVAFGAYPQGAQGEVEPIRWRVLTADEGQAYLLSEYVLTNNRVHPDDNEYIAFGGAFNRTEVFTLLNGPYDAAVFAQSDVRDTPVWTAPFIDEAFTPQEQAHIVNTQELGRVFLPSAEDLKNAGYGFTSDEARRGYGTPYAFRDGGYGTKKSLTDGLFQYGNGSSPYWTRSQSLSFDYGVRCTKEEGKLGYIRCVVMNEGLRPAIYLNLEGATVAQGRGTLEEPYTLAW